MFSLACFGIGSGCRDVSVWFGFGFGFGFGLVSFQLRNFVIRMKLIKSRVQCRGRDDADAEAGAAAEPEADKIA